MPFKTCPVCGLTYNINIIKHSHNFEIISKRIEKEIITESTSTGFKAYLERFGVKELK